MKKLFFSFVMMFALVIMTGSAFAQVGTAIQPYIGSTHDFTLPITVSANGTVEVYLSSTQSLAKDLATTGNWSISGGTVNGSSGTLAISTTTHYGGSVTTATSGITFNMTFSSGLTALTPYYLIVNVQETGGCNNWISLTITPQVAPTLALDMGADAAAVCQTLGAAANNIDAASGAGNTSSSTFVITPTTTAIGYTYDFTLTLAPSQYLSGDYTMTTSSGTINNTTKNVAVVTGAAAGATTITVTWTTKEGGAINIVGTLVADQMILSSAEGGQTITGGTITGGTRTVPVNAMPTIGTFTY